MKYKDFNNIDIEVRQGVCPVSGDTTLVAEYASKVGAQKCLDMGTGTGFVAIYLASMGCESHASDIHAGAIEITRENAKRNDVMLTLHTSNLFSNIPESFDLITFNPPYGSTGSSTLTSVFEFIKSLIPRNNRFIAELSYKLTKKSRRRLITQFLREARDHVHKEHTILLLVHRLELDLLLEYNPNFVGSWRDVRLAEFSFPS